MNEFGEEVTIYVWPTDVADGEPYGDDFYQRLTKALRAEQLDWELV
jgi:hypothetical protein